MERRTVTTAPDDWQAEAFAVEWRQGRGKHRHLYVSTPSGRRIQIVESPTGRVLHVHVDAHQWQPAP